MLHILPKFSGNRTKSGSITDPEELLEAGCRIFPLVQTESFSAEKKNLLTSSPISKTSVLVTSPPFIVPNQLLRAIGPTKRPEVATFDVKHPILLDSRTLLVHLYLQYSDNKHSNQGVEYLRALIQQRFAIVTLGATLRSIEFKCVPCRKRKAVTLNPMILDVPKERLALGYPPFTNTALLYFGPFYVSVKRSSEKRCGFHFTCLTTRAVVFEVVPSMVTNCCALGIEKFVSAQCVPFVIWFNNGRNFIASEKELLNNILNWNQQTSTETLDKKCIK